jgi:cellulose synthase/poly-beta-1,6-N-acetylglucosamine synthase-like glycosyltransferase
MPPIKPNAVSVIIPCYNAENIVTRTLDALDRQTVRGFEVVAVDDGSADGTVSVLKSYRPKNYRLTVLAEGHKGPAAQRNMGVKRAKGGIVVFTDSDCVPDKNWLSEMMGPFGNKDVAGVSGTYRTLNADKIIARFEGYEIEKRHLRLARQERIDFVGSFSASYRKDIFRRFGGFSTEFRTADAEDPELSFKMAEAGHKLVFNPKAVVAHPHVDSLGRYWKQKLSRGFWRVLLYRKHPEKMKGDSYTGVEVPLSLLAAAVLLLSMGGFVLSSLVGRFLLGRGFYVVVAALSFVGFCGINFGTVLFMAKKEKKMLLFAPLMMLVRTLAWGIGFACGLINTLFGASK